MGRLNPRGSPTRMSNSAAAAHTEAGEKSLHAFADVVADGPASFDGLSRGIVEPKPGSSRWGHGGDA
jgi:hypothetical protein